MVQIADRARSTFHTNGVMAMRRLLLSSLVAVLMAVPAAAQLTLVPNTFAGHPGTDIIFRVAAGFSNGSSFGGLQFTRAFPPIAEFFGRATLHNGATVVGDLGPGPTYSFWGFDFFADPNTLIGGFVTDPEDWGVVTCGADRPPSGFLNGRPYWGSPAFTPFGYFNACPGQYVEVTVSTPFQLTLVGAVTTTPEPGSIVLMATGLLGLAGIALRRRIDAQA